MLKALITYILIGSCLTASAQQWPGLTGTRDTSYNNGKAYRDSKRSNPETELVAVESFADVSKKENITYKKERDRKLQLDAFTPKEKAAQLRTAIIIIHGGGWRSGNRQQHHVLAQHLAHKGYVCFTPEYRLSTEALFPAAVYDLKEAVRWVRKNAGKYNLDTSKITVLGFSAGGELAAFLGTTGNMPLFEGETKLDNHSTKPNAVINIDGTLSFVHSDQKEGDDSKRISAATNWFGVARKDNYVLWEAASPLSYVNATTPPTLFLNSSVSAMHAGREDYVSILNKHKIYSEVHTFQNAPHSFCLFEPWFTPTVNYIDGFLKQVFTSQ